MALIPTLIVLATLFLIAEHALATFDAWRSERTRFWYVLLPASCCILVLGLRVLVVPPSFTHDNFHATELLDTMLGSTRHNPRVASYGPVGFVVLGTAASWFGRSASTILYTNLVISVLVLFMVGTFFGRAYARPKIVALTILGGSLLPPMSRVGFSEDLHALGMFYGVSFLLLFDRYVRRGRPHDALLSVVAIALMLYTRQTFIAFAPFAILMVLSKNASNTLHRRRAIMVSAVVLGATVHRTIASLSDAADAGTYDSFRYVVTHIQVLAPMVRDHWFFAFDRLGLYILPVTLAGIYISGASPFSRVHLLTLVSQFVITATFHRENPGSELCMRTVFTMMSLGYVALTAAALDDWLALRIPTGASTLIIGAMLVLAPSITARSRADNQYQSIEYQEYVYVESVVRRLPRRFVLIEPARPDGEPAVELPYRVFELAGVTARRAATMAEVRPGETVLVFEGLNCWSYSLQELYGLTRWDREHIVDSPRALRFLADFFREGSAPTVPIPATMREACSTLLGHGQPLPIPAGHLHPHTVKPFAHFADSTSIPLRFHRIATHENLVPGAPSSTPLEAR